MSDEHNDVRGLALRLANEARTLRRGMDAAYHPYTQPSTLLTLAWREQVRREWLDQVSKADEVILGKARELAGEFAEEVVYTDPRIPMAVVAVACDHCHHAQQYPVLATAMTAAKPLWVVYWERAKRALGLEVS